MAKSKAKRMPSIPEIIERVQPEYPKEVEEIIAAWNSKGITRHKPTNVKLRNTIQRVIREYPKEEILLAIDNYATIYHDPDYYFSYAWSLSMFLNKANAMPEFLPEGGKWINYCNRKEKEKTKKLEPVQPQKEPPSPATGGTMDQFYELVLSHLRRMPYGEYLRTNHWQHFRKEALKFAHSTCQLCGGTNTTLNVHHRTYANRGRETFLDVIVLCDECHTSFHHRNCGPECERCHGAEEQHAM